MYFYLRPNCISIYDFCIRDLTFVRYLFSHILHLSKHCIQEGRVLLGVILSKYGALLVMICCTVVLVNYRIKSTSVGQLMEVLSCRKKQRVWSLAGRWSLWLPVLGMKHPVSLSFSTLHASPPRNHPFPDLRRTLNTARNISEMDSF